MRVGVFLEKCVPEDGGGYTFQWDVFTALLDLAGESRHEFTAFYPSKLPFKPSTFSTSRRIRIVGYSPPSVIEGAISRLSREFACFRRIYSRPSHFDRLARDTGIEFMCLWGPSPIRLDIPYLSIVWDLQHRVQPWFPELDGDIGWQARERYYSWFLPRATVVIAGTEVGRKEIELFYKVPADRIKILPHPTPRFALDAPPDSGDRVLKKYGIPDKYLYYPAQFWSHKNHANLLLAARKLRDEHKLVLPVVLVGSDKGNLGYIRRLVKRLDLTSQVYFLGFVCLADLIALYRRAFALTYVTFFGPENLPPLEAFALGCPVIASNVPGAQEQLGDAALLVNPRDPDDIALAVKNLFTNQELRNVLLQRGRERALKWTARDFVKGIFSILDSFEAVRRCWGEYWGSYE